jgi:hypothetical protein
LYLAFVAGDVRLSRFSVRPLLVPAAAVLIAQILPFSAGRGLLLDIDGDPARAELDAIVRQIPPGVSVISPQHVQPHLSDRTVSAYLRDGDEINGDHPPFEYVVLPVSANPPRAGYELAWRGTAYVLFRLRAPALAADPDPA